MGISMEFSRSTKAATASTTLLDSRPNFLWTFQKVMLFRGEEKATNRELGDAVEENNKKIGWHTLIYGTQLPYVLTYAAAGSLIRFYVLRRGSNRSVPVTRVFNMINPSDRLEALFCCMNIMRLCVTLIPLCPSNALSVGEKLVSSTCTVTINEKFVLKVVRISGSRHLTDVTTLKQLYADLVAHSVPCTTRATVEVKRTDELHLRITPLALQVYPLNEAELKTCIRCVLSALLELHRLEWVHRDIRWPNVLYETENQWILSDFENSDRENCQVTWHNPALPLEVQSGAPYLRSGDMYLIGWLLTDERIELILMQAPLAVVFRNKCLEGEPTRRPTAQQALQDPWLLA